MKTRIVSFAQIWVVFVYASYPIVLKSNYIFIFFNMF